MFKRYDYKCTVCEGVEEHWCNTDEPFNTCTDCGETSQRIISPIRSQFKGMGWPDADDKWAKDHERAAKRQTI